MYTNMELRKLPAGTLCEVFNTLETNNDWKTVMALIPKNPNNIIFEPKYNDDDIRLIENHSKATNRQCAEILIDEWGTSGQVRPTLSTLKEITLKANILKAADQIAALLKENRPPRPGDGPGADIDTNVTNILENEDIKQRFNSLDPTKRIQNEFSIDKNVFNASTAAIKSENKKDNFSYNIPNIELLNPKGTSCLSEYNTDNSRQFLEASRNMPNFNLLLSKQQNSDKNLTNNTSDNKYELSRDCHEQYQNQAEFVNNSYQKSLPNISNLQSYIDKEILEDRELINFNYSDLESITNNFSETIIDGPNGPSGKIGSGGFGEVFVGSHPSFKKPLAVKKIYQNSLWQLHNPQLIIEMFNTEVKNLTQLRHKNILPILGFSMNGPVPCMISEYIEGGSLLHQINNKVLNERQRIDIMCGTAEGLKYLHSKEVIVKDTNDVEIVIKKNSFVHRDVKSANILITKDFIPKLGDFGLVKQQQSTCITDIPKGTSAYMAPEGFSGTISPKIDIYSYGIVLLELLTGQKPIIGTNITINIKDYVSDHINEHGNIKGILDPVVEWEKAEEIYTLSQSCLEYDRNRRPSIEKVCNELNNIGNTYFEDKK